MSNAMLQEMRKFNDNFAKLQSELVVTKRVNSELCKRTVTVERQRWANAQYSRRECLEVAGISRQVDDKNLETKVLPIFQTIGYTIDPTFIDDCHRISKNNDRVTVCSCHVTYAFESESTLYKIMLVLPVSAGYYRLVFPWFVGVYPGLDK